MKQEFILASSSPIRDTHQIQLLKKIEGVREVYGCFGFQYDIIMRVEASDIEGLRRIEKQVRRTPGMKMVLTMLIRE